MGPPGSFRSENAAEISNSFNWKCIMTGELLKKEIKSKTPEGKLIQQRFKAY
jgi:adenylate kinase family enzyme